MEDRVRALFVLSASRDASKRARLLHFAAGVAVGAVIAAVILL